MRHVEQMKLRKGMSVSQLVKEMNATGVLGAGKIGEATELVSEMFNDPDYTVFNFSWSTCSRWFQTNHRRLD